MSQTNVGVELRSINTRLSSVEINKLDKVNLSDEPQLNESDVAASTVATGKLFDSIYGLSTNIDILHSDITTLYSDMDSLTTDMEVAESDIKEIQQDIEGLKSDISKKSSLSYFNHTLIVEKWIDGTQEILNSLIPSPANSGGSIAPNITSTAEQKQAFYEAGLYSISQMGGKLILGCFGEVPEIPIPISIEVRQ